ncbi:Endonuclease/Exonuclease/phosphatase_family protein [Hexamita inflata]|uniref:Endonuclease/Exonuclease/phosphatase_family protein n=1 Tax=Hexamita inflata TaxID=28002 RepID=A0ABP1HEN8_9EUKA
MFHHIHHIIRTEFKDLQGNNYNITGYIIKVQDKTITLQGQTEQDIITCKFDKYQDQLNTKQYVKIYMCSVLQDYNSQINMLYLDTKKQDKPVIITYEDYNRTEWTKIGDRNEFPKLVTQKSFVNELPGQIIPTKLVKDLRIISYNINGLNKTKIELLQSLCQRQMPDVICLQETKCSPIDVENIIKQALPNYIIIQNPAKQYQTYDYQYGVVVIVKTDIMCIDQINIKQSEQALKALQHRYNLVQIGDFLLFNLYAPFSLNHYQERMNFDQELYNLVMQCKRHKLLLVGDLNVVSQNYFEHVASCTDKEISNFKNLILDSDLLEVKVNNEQKLTVFNNFCSQIDHILVSQQINFKNQRILFEYYKCGSDHIPLSVDIEYDYKQETKINLIDDYKNYIQSVVKLIFSSVDSEALSGIEKFISLINQNALNAKMQETLDYILSKYIDIKPEPLSYLNISISKKFAELYVNSFYDDLPQIIFDKVKQCQNDDLKNEYYIIILQIFQNLKQIHKDDFSQTLSYKLEQLQVYSQNILLLNLNCKNQKLRNQMSRIIMSMYSIDIKVSEIFNNNQKQLAQFIIDNIKYNTNNEFEYAFNIQLAIQVAQIYVSQIEFEIINPGQVLLDIIPELCQQLCRSGNKDEIQIAIILSFINWEEKRIFSILETLYLVKICKQLYEMCTFLESDIKKAEIFDPTYIDNQILNTDENLTSVAGRLLGIICKHNNNIELNLQKSVQQKIKRIDTFFQQLQIFKILITEKCSDNIITQLRSQYINDITNFMQIVQEKYKKILIYPVLYQGEILKFYFDLFDQISQSEVDYFLENIPTATYENQYTATMLAQGFIRVINSKQIKNNKIKNSEQFVVKFLQSNQITLQHNITCCQACCCLIQYCNTPINHFRDTQKLLFKLLKYQFEKETILPFANLLLEQVKNVTQNMKIQFIQDLINYVKFQLPDNELDNALHFVIQLLSICSRYCQSPLFNLIMNMALSQDCHNNANLSQILLLFINNYISTAQFQNGEQMYIQTNSKLQQIYKSNITQINQLKTLLIKLISNQQTAPGAYQTLSLIIQNNFELEVEYLSQIVKQTIKYNNEPQQYPQQQKYITIFYCCLFNKYDQYTEIIFKNANTDLSCVLLQLQKGCIFFINTDTKEYLCEGLYKIYSNSKVNKHNRQIIKQSICSIFQQSITSLVKQKQLLNRVEHYGIKDDPVDLKIKYIQKMQENRK